MGATSREADDNVGIFTSTVRWDPLEDFGQKSGRIPLCRTDWRGPGGSREASGRSPVTIQVIL